MPSSGCACRTTCSSTTACRARTPTATPARRRAATARACATRTTTKTCPGVDECNGGCDTTSGQCTPKASTPCTDTDGNVCTLAGCEISPSNAELGVCVQTHTFATDSTPCPDGD